MKQENVEIFTNTRIKSVLYLRNYFNVKLDNNSIISSKIVIGSYGKRDLLDRQLNRDFFKAKTGYMAVKYHIKTSYAANEIGLDNFKDGYCGISKIEEDKYCLCYLTKRSNIAGLNSIKQMEEEVLYKNSRLKHIFEHSEFLFSKPEVINEISISPKSLIENHILMCGDSAGMILLYVEMEWLWQSTQQK
ncbi:MAG: hypothetical protein H0V01_08640 [Bacteroidetes bacterium]|nr:hypothetical protein [Bacteroidota bacterium]HET6244556.1 hypothetical protein [Bacteroidia bacterium]